MAGEVLGMFRCLRLERLFAPVVRHRLRRTYRLHGGMSLMFQPSTGLRPFPCHSSSQGRVHPLCGEASPKLLPAKAYLNP
jgi:hypothetical protein